MSDEPRLGVWKVVGLDKAAPIICDLGDNKIAVIAKTSQGKLLARAGIIAAAPALYEVMISALGVFQAIAEHGSGPAALAAHDMIPSLESVLEAANFLEPITEEALIGS
jgi:hypothetical protein